MSLSVLLGVVALLAVGGAVYLATKAAMLQNAASSLQAELKQFKEGGFDRLVTEKLAILTQRATEALQSREQWIRQNKQELLDEVRKSATAAEQFQRELGIVSAHLMGLRELQGQVSELSGLLKPQQVRGELGEVIVRSILADKLPVGHYEENFTFLDGKQVEFAIRLNGRMIPVDSKLPLDDFKRLRESVDERGRQACRTDLKRTLRKKIDEVKAYIRPEEGTYNFALMVIPSEAVYYDVIADREFSEPGGLSAYAAARNVFLVSPNTFWAYLTAIAHGLHGLEIERHAEQILASLQTLATKIRRFSQDEFHKLGAHLKDAAKKYDEADRRLRDIDAGLGALERAEAKPSLEPLALSEAAAILPNP